MGNDHFNLGSAIRYVTLVHLLSIEIGEFFNMLQRIVKMVKNWNILLGYKILVQFEVIKVPFDKYRFKLLSPEYNVCYSTLIIELTT